MHARAAESVYAYIRGKVLISAFVALLHAVQLWIAGLNLWLVFGVISFWLNFIPNVRRHRTRCMAVDVHPDECAWCACVICACVGSVLV